MRTHSPWPMGSVWSKSGKLQVTILTICAKFVFATVTHEHTVISETASLEEERKFAGAIIGPYAVIGPNVIVNIGASDLSSLRVGRYVHVGPGVMICGGVTIGRGAFVGAGSLVLGGVGGSNAILAAGATLISDLAEGSYGQRFACPRPLRFMECVGAISPGTRLSITAGPCGDRRLVRCPANTPRFRIRPHGRRGRRALRRHPSCRSCGLFQRCRPPRGR